MSPIDCRRSRRRAESIGVSAVMTHDARRAPINPTMRRLLLVVVVGAAIVASAFGQDRWSQESVTEGEIIPATVGFPCHSLAKENYTCGACIQLHDSCAWCMDFSFNNMTSFSRCDSLESLLEHGCARNQIVNPQSTIRTIASEDFVDGDEDAESIQLRPQEVEVRLRPKSKARFEVQFRQPSNYPVDLYYLMDLSYSMKDDKEKLSQLGDLLAERMKQITRNFRLGFGSFIDKKVMPFVDPRPEKQASPCSEGCAPTYGFRHQMKLDQNTQKFAKEVEKAEISGNLDAPEGGFDAIVQAIACNSTIGWRERSRKMIVFSTDAGFHFAGDGRLGGIITPSDGQCHLDAAGYFTASTTQDYPSIAQIHKAIKDAKLNVIFAVTKANRQLYEQLSQALPDVSTSVGVLAQDSSNIVDLIEAQYATIAERIHMVDSANNSQGLRISYRAKCGHSSSNDVWQETNACDKVAVGDVVTYEVTLEATHCLPSQRDFAIHVGPSGLDETLLINVHVLCDCDCEDEIVYRAPECNGGDLVCGVCKCPPGFVGDKCQCEAGALSEFALESKCRKDNNSLICSGRGVCECGVCRCIQRSDSKEVVSGQFCECDNYSCPRHNRKLCNDHGRCVCGTCECEEGWTGPACECPLSKETCLDARGRECSGHGKCVCGKCMCDENFSGPLCDVCPTCPSKCVEYKPCVMCQQWGTGPYNDTMCAECPFDVIPVKELPVLNVTDGDTSNECQFVDPADDCTFYFLYYYDGINNLTVWVKEHKDCPAPLPVLVIVLIVIAGIVLLGLLLLCLWKLLTVIYDRREYVRFKKDTLNARWDTNENPIYRQATTTFRNPVYGGEPRSK